MIRNFVGLKIGDVNASAEADHNMQTAAVRNLREIEWLIQDMNVKSGEIFEIPFRSKDFFDIYGFQFQLDIKNAVIERIENGAISISQGQIAMNSTGISVSVDLTTGETFAEEDILFTLQLKANSDTRISEILGFDESRIKAEIYQGVELGILTPRLSYKSTVIDKDNQDLVLYQNEPNPFKESTIIGFYLPHTGKATLTIVDASGKILYNHTDVYPKGENVVSVKRNEIHASGLLYYTIESGDVTLSKRMIILD